MRSHPCTWRCCAPQPAGSVFAFRAATLATVASLFVAVGSMTAAAQGGKTVLEDSVRFRGTEWTVVPLVTLDSSRNADTLAIRQVGRVYVLGQGRLVFEGRRTRGGRWALFTVMDGTVRRLVEMGRAFTLPDGRKHRIEIGLDGFVEAGRVTLRAHGPDGVPNVLLSTDGVSWRRELGGQDTIRLGEAPAVVDWAGVISAERDSSLVLSVSFREPKTNGVVRLKNGLVERILMSGDSLPGVGVADAGYRVHGAFGTVELGLKQFVLTSQGWIAVFRTRPAGKYQEFLIARTRDAAPRELLRAEPWDRAVDSLGMATVLPGDNVIMSRGGAIGVVDTAGAWRPLLSAEDIAAPKKETFHLTEVTPLDGSGGALLSIHFSRFDTYSMGTSGIAYGTSWSAWPKLFYFDGSQAKAVRVDTTKVTGSLYTNLRPQPVVRPVPGYQAGVIITQPYFLSNPKSPAMYFDAGLESPVTAPAFRTASGDIELHRLVGWNSDTEAVGEMERPRVAQAAVRLLPFRPCGAPNPLQRVVRQRHVVRVAARQVEDRW